MNILFLVLAGGGAEHIHDESIQRATWAGPDSSNHKIVWVRAGTSLKFDSYSRNLYVPCAEGELLKKSIYAINWALLNIDFDIMVRTNVSTFFVIEYLRKHLISKQFDDNHFGGHLHFKKKTSSNSHNSFFISGTGIFLGRNSAKSLCEMKSIFYSMQPDDVAITDYLSNAPSLNLVSVPRLSLSNHHFFFPSFFIRCKTSWNAELASKRMLLLHHYFDSTGKLTKSRDMIRLYCNEFLSCRRSPLSFVNYLNRIRVEIMEYFLNVKFRL